MKDTLKFYNDFPKQGIVFVDIIPFLQDKKTFRQLVDELGKCLTAPNIAAPEARGFLFTAPLLVTDPRVENIIPIRKSGKLPFAEGDLCEVKVEKEYGFDKLYYRISDIAAGRADDGLFHISVIDDVLATGGTAEGIAQSLLSQKITVDGKEYGVAIDEFIFIVELDGLSGRKRLEKIAEWNSPVLWPLALLIFGIAALAACGRYVLERRSEARAVELQKESAS